MYVSCLRRTPTGLHGPATRGWPGSSASHTADLPQARRQSRRPDGGNKALGNFAAGASCDASNGDNATMPRTARTQAALNRQTPPERNRNVRIHVASPSPSGERVHTVTTLSDGGAQRKLFISSCRRYLPQRATASSGRARRPSCANSLNSPTFRLCPAHLRRRRGRGPPACHPGAVEEARSPGAPRPYWRSAFGSGVVRSSARRPRGAKPRAISRPTPRRRGSVCMCRRRSPWSATPNSFSGSSATQPRPRLEVAGPLPRARPDRRSTGQL